MSAITCDPCRFGVVILTAATWRMLCRTIDQRMTFNKPLTFSPLPFVNALMQHDEFRIDETFWCIGPRATRNIAAIRLDAVDVERPSPERVGTLSMPLGIVPRMAMENSLAGHDRSSSPLRTARPHRNLQIITLDNRHLGGREKIKNVIRFTCRRDSG